MEPKPKSQYKAKLATLVAVELPDDFYDRAEALAGPRGLWRERGAFVIEMIGLAGKKKKTIIRQAACDIWDCKEPTIREDEKNARELGNWCDEMPYKISRQRIRLFRQESKLRGVDIFVVLDEDAKTIDKRGKPCSIRVIEARVRDLRNGKKGDKGNPVVSRLSAGVQSAATALKRSQVEGEPCAVLALQIEDWLNLGEALLERAEAAANYNLTSSVKKEK